MILSHRYRFIFLKTTKTAGTSIEIGLSRFLGPEDVITPISERDEHTRQGLGHRGPQNYQLDDPEPLDGEDAKVLNKVRRRGGYYNHMSAREVRALVSADVWTSYYKFCFERNPWDRAISLYYWLHRKAPRPSLSEFVHSNDLQRLKRKGYEVYTIDGDVVVDCVGRYEHLEVDLESIRLGLGLPEPIELPQTKAHLRPDRRAPSEVLTLDDRARIAELFADEIEMLGYTCA